MAVVDETGNVYGRVKVIKRNEKNSNARKAQWDCLCECGNTFTVVGSSLRSGNTTSCGCYKKEKISELKKADLVGKTFGLLTVISENPIRLNKKVCFDCECSCGGKKTVRGSDLISGKTNSCGCIVSMGERKLIKIFLENNIKYIKEKTFEDCRSSVTSRLYRFDFQIEINDEKFLIEYNGEQHYQNPKSNQSNWGSLEKCEFRDKEKIKYCKDNDLKLIIIPYWDYDKLSIDYILQEVQNAINR